LLLLLNKFASSQTIVDVVVGSPDHNTLEAAVLAAPSAILDTLNDSTSDLTLFAPDDAAFENVDSTYLTNLLTPEWSNHLVCLLTSHVLPVRVLSTDLTIGKTTVETLSTEKIVVEKIAPNGLDPGSVSVDGVTVTAPDIVADNGVIHSISERPILPSCIEGNIVEKLKSIKWRFRTLINLVQSAGLEETLASGESLTIFAPTNAAFRKLDNYILDFLSEDIEALTKVLTYHVVAGNAYLDATSYTSLEGGALNITSAEDELQVNGIHIEKENLLAGNGVVHQIDEVLIPEDLVLPDPPECEGLACFFGGLPCFSGSAMVDSLGKGPIPMKDLQIGDEIAVGNGRYEPVYSFGHYHPTAQSKDFVQLTTKDNGSMKVSEEHLVFVQEDGAKKAVTAGSLQKGDRLIVDDAATAVITSVQKSVTIRDGLYAPFTPSGTFLVNDHFLVSSFIGGYDQKSEGLNVLGIPFSFQWMSHAFEFPHRVVCHYLGSCPNETYDADGLSQGWATFPLSFVNEFVFGEDNMYAYTKPLILSMMVGVFAVFNFIEMAVFQYPMLVVMVAAIQYLSNSNQKKKMANKNVV